MQKSGTRNNRPKTPNAENRRVVPNTRRVVPNTRTRFPAANWLATKIDGQPYRLESTPSPTRVPGLHPPVKNASIHVVYSQASPSKFDPKKTQETVLKVLYALPRDTRLLIAMEFVDQMTREHILTNVLMMRSDKIQVFFKTTFESKSDVIDQIDLLLDARGNVANVARLANKYQTAAGPSLASHTSILREVRDGVADAKGQAFARIPRKKQVKETVSQWTTGVYRRVQNARRTSASNERNNVFDAHPRQINYALAHHMQHMALRAPEMPPKIRNMATKSETPILYRGFHLTQTQYDAMLASRSVSDLGFMAFSRNKDVSLHFLSKRGQTLPVLARMNARTDVQPGTPWVWFACDQERWNKRSVGSFCDEKEVLLPPGTLTIKNMVVHGDHLEIHVSYTQGGNPMNRHKRVAQLRVS